MIWPAPIAADEGTEHDMLGADQQHDERRRGQIKHVAAATGADLVGRAEDERVDDREKHERRRKRAEPVQQRQRGECGRKAGVDQPAPEHPGCRVEHAQDRKKSRLRGRNPRRDVHGAQPPRHLFRIALGAEPYVRKIAQNSPRIGVSFGPPHAAVKLDTGSAVRSHRRSSAPL